MGCMEMLCLSVCVIKLRKAVQESESRGGSDSEATQALLRSPCTAMFVTGRVCKGSLGTISANLRSLA